MDGTRLTSLRCIPTLRSLPFPARATRTLPDGRLSVSGLVTCVWLSPLQIISGEGRAGGKTMQAQNSRRATSVAQTSHTLIWHADFAAWSDNLALLVLSRRDWQCSMQATHLNPPIKKLGPIMPLVCSRQASSFTTRAGTLQQFPKRGAPHILPVLRHSISLCGSAEAFYIEY